MVRRIVRQRVGLTAHNEAGADAHTASMGLDFGQADGGRAGSDFVLVTTAEPRLKLSVLLNLALDSELARPPQAKVLEVHTSYVELQKRSEDTEPTLEQVSAVHQVITADLVPFVDFSLFGPQGKRLLHKFTYLSWTFMPDGSWLRSELPGPQSLWVLVDLFQGPPHCALAVGRGSPEILDNYGEMVRSQSFLCEQHEVRRLQR